MHKNRPIGIQTLREIREDGCSVDKTGMAVDLLAQGSHYFLSRPRRFGKSLFLNALKELSEGNRAEMDQRIEKILTGKERRLGLQSGHGSISGRFSDPLRQAHQATGQRAVVLVDDHDKRLLEKGVSMPELECREVGSSTPIRRLEPASMRHFWRA